MQGVIPDRRYSPQPAHAVEPGEIPGADSKVWYVEDHHNDVSTGRRPDGVPGFFVVVVETKKMTSWRLYYVSYPYPRSAPSRLGMHECLGLCLNAV